MKPNVSRMDAKGRISIPFSLRHLLRLEFGDKLVIDMTDHELVLIPVRKEESA